MCASTEAKKKRHQSYRVMSKLITLRRRRFASCYCVHPSNHRVDDDCVDDYSSLAFTVLAELGAKDASFFPDTASIEPFRTTVGMDL